MFFVRFEELTVRIIDLLKPHFWLSGYVNKQNCLIWADEQPEEYQEQPLYPLKTTVCCGLWAGAIIGPYFFKNEANQNVTVNGNRYRTMLSEYVLPEIQAHGLGELFFKKTAPRAIQRVK